MSVLGPGRRASFGRAMQAENTRTIFINNRPVRLAGDEIKRRSWVPDRGPFPPSGIRGRCFFPNRTLDFPSPWLGNFFFCFSGEFHLGFSRSELQGVSWYQLLHWECMREAQSKHRLSEYYTHTYICTHVTAYTIRIYKREAALSLWTFRISFVQLSGDPGVDNNILTPRQSYNAARLLVTVCARETRRS